MILTRLPVKAMTLFTSQGGRPALEDHALALQDKGIFVVADGFGGSIAGELAARTACEGVRDFLDKEAGDLDATLPFVLRSYFSLAGNVLFNALIYANRKVIAQNKGKNVHEKGGASVVAGYMDGDLLALANVGACTAWLLRDGKSVELVVPRTLGRLREPFLEESPDSLRAPLTALGMSNDLEPEIFEYRVRPGDWLILHTDGLTSQVREMLVETQARGLSPSKAAQEIAIALKGSSYTDNVATSVMVF